MYDIIIVGAGPAGANLARLLGNRYRVLLLEKREIEGEAHGGCRSKCCGGLLAPEAQKMLAVSGLSLPVDVLVEPQLFAVRTLDLPGGVERMYQRHYFNMDRDKFDRWLISLIPSGVEQVFGAGCKGFHEVPGGYEVRFLHRGRERFARAKLIVGADGALSVVRRGISSDAMAPDRYIAIQESYECRMQMPYYTAIFDQGITDFYSWMIPKGEHLLLGAALRPGGDAWDKYLLLKSKLSRLGFEFGRKIKTEGAHILRPKSPSQLLTGKAGIALVGEAAGAISPSSAEGISYALKSSIYLAQSLDDGIEGFLAGYQHAMGDIRRNLLLKNMKSPAMYQPFLRKMAMSSGLFSIRCDSQSNPGFQPVNS